MLARTELWSGILHRRVISKRPSEPALVEDKRVCLVKMHPSVELLHLRLEQYPAVGKEGRSSSMDRSKVAGFHLVNLDSG